MSGADRDFLNAAQRAELLQEIADVARDLNRMGRVYGGVSGDAISGYARALAQAVETALNDEGDGSDSVRESDPAKATN